MRITLCDVGPRDGLQNDPVQLEPAQRAELVDRWSRHFEEVAEEVAREIDAHTKEPVAEGEADGAFVMTRVKLRCFELFTRFDEESRARLLAIAEQMIAADGVVHPEELRFRDELHALLDAPQQLDDVEVEVKGRPGQQAGTEELDL